MFVGTWFDGLMTGLLCQILGMILGYSYIKLIEERELMLRFGQPYKKYLLSTPLFIPALCTKRRLIDD
jgi:protein-S-isoprenylcysteine O-methyltransferase Ste14